MLMAFSDLDRLFIIGNGFDLAHGLKTSYENFRQYLLNVENIQTPGENFCPNDILQLISRCAGTARWCDIETDLGYVSGQVKKYVDETKDYDVQRLQGALLGGILEDIPKYVSSWIAAVDCKQAKPMLSFKKLIDKDKDYFLTFNYTDTLERLYEAKKVCHIHGKYGERIVFGHGEELTYGREFHLREDLECGLVEAYLDLQKDPNKNMEKHREFIDAIGKLQAVYSYGFSFSKPDRPYISRICKKTTTNTTWHLSNYESTLRKKEYQVIIGSCGFAGSFCEFSL